MNVWIQNPFDNLPIEGYRKQRFWLMSEAFAAAGHAVVFWTSDFSHANKRMREKAKGEGQGGEGFELVMIPTRAYGKNVCLERIRSHREYARTWERMARTAVERGEMPRPDLIVSSLPTISAAATALKLGRAFGAKVAVDVMDAWPETFERLAPKGLRWLVRLALWPQRMTARRIYREADFVTGVCERYRELTGRKDYYLAYHGIDLTGGDAPEAGRHGAGAEGREGKSVRLVYAGNLGRTYDLETVLKAVAENPDFTLDIAGKWDRDVPERVTAHGYLGQEELRKLLGSCDVGIIPMLSDSWVGIPYKMCDYAKAGLRIVSCLGGESSRLLEKYRCGATYRWGDAASLAAAVRAAQACESARTMCEQEFDAARIYRAYVERVQADPGFGDQLTHSHHLPPSGRIW